MPLQLALASLEPNDELRNYLIDLLKNKYFDKVHLCYNVLIYHIEMRKQRGGGQIVLILLPFTKAHRPEYSIKLAIRQRCHYFIKSLKAIFLFKVTQLEFSQQRVHKYIRQVQRKFRLALSLDKMMYRKL